MGYPQTYTQTILSGSLSGAIGYIGTLPLDYIKQHLQSAASDRHLLYQNIDRHGVKILFRGGLLGCYSIIPQMTIKFTANDLLNRNMPENGPYLNGFIAGYLDGSFLGPVLSLQSMQQMRNNYGYKESFKILRSVPILSMTFPLALRNATYTSIMFGGNKTLGWDSTFLSASLLNIPAVIACSPFDVIRANQIRNMLEGKTNNPVMVACEIYRAGGLKGFYRGFGSLYINFALRFPVTFAIFNWLTAN